MRPTVIDPVNGLVLLNKEPGRTSFQSLYPVKKLYGNTVGHTGTLDSFAEGLLVVLIGKFTKFTPLFTAFDKVYEADFTFGIETDTLDPEGAVVHSAPVPEYSVVDFAENFQGPQMQIPPDYSAIHVDGRRASERMRSGQTLVLPPRPVTIFDLKVLTWKPPVLSVRIHCSKGTYVRSIARDWGRLAGCGAHVTRLKRLSVGPFSLPESPMEFKNTHWTLDRLGIPTVKVPEENLNFVLNGRVPEIFVPGLKDLGCDQVGLENSAGEVFAFLERTGGRWSYLFVDRGPEK